MPTSPGVIAGVVFNDEDRDASRDTGEGAMSDVTVTLEQRISGGTQDRGSRRTDREGQYAFRDLPSGMYRVTVQPSGGFGATTTQVEVAVNGDIRTVNFPLVRSSQDGTSNENGSSNGSGNSNSNLNNNDISQRLPTAAPLPTPRPAPTPGPTFTPAAIPQPIAVPAAKPAASPPASPAASPSPRVPVIAPVGAAAPQVPAAKPAAPAAPAPAAKPAGQPTPRAGGFPLELALPMIGVGAAALGGGGYLLRRSRRPRQGEHRVASGE